MVTDCANNVVARAAEELCSDILASKNRIRPSKRYLNDLSQRYFALNDELRFYIMHHISHAASKVARRLLVEILQRDPSILVRHEAAFALGCIGRSDDLRHVRRALLRDRNSLVRHEAAMALGAKGGRSDISTLRRGLSDSNQMVVQSCRAAITLIQMRHNNAKH
jgi:HEAT repeat protein